MKDQRHQAALNKVIDSIYKETQRKILDFAECAIEGKDRWKAVRSRVLGVTNSAKRELKDELQRNWTVKFTPKTVVEDVIQVGRPVKEKEIKNDGKKTKTD